MAKTISQLTDATSVGASDEIIVQQSGVTKRATVTELKAQVATIGANDITVSGANRSITNTGNFALSFGTNNTERVRIDASGNTGVGTASPATTLDVNGDVTITDKIIHSGDTNTAIRFPSNDTLAIETAGTERMRIDAIGNVGIGTTPSQKLHVLTGVNQYGLFVSDGTREGGLVPSSATGGLILYNSVAQPIGIWTNNTERMRIDSSGNVLIGTNSSTLGKLQVEGGRSIFAASSEQYTVGAKFSAAGGAVYFGAASASATPDAVISSAGGATLMTLTNGGSLRIEAGDLLVASDKEINFNLGNDANNRILVNSVTGAMEVRAFNGQRFFTTNGGDSERMRIDSSGNVGIGGTANAAAILDAASTTKGFLPPRMTTAQRDAITTPPAGLMVYNTSTNKLNFYNGSAWEAVTSA
jgi:hypothetical protein